MILFVVTFLFINNSSTKGEISEASPSINPEIQAENEKKLKEVEEFLLYQEGGFFEQVNNELEEKVMSFKCCLQFIQKMIFG